MTEPVKTTLCRTCGAEIPRSRCYCETHRQENRLASRRESYARKLALKPEFIERGLKFEAWRSLGQLRRQLGGLAPDRLPNKARVPKPHPVVILRTRRRGFAVCQNPICGRSFAQTRRDQRYCKTRPTDCQKQAWRIQHIWVPGWIRTYFNATEKANPGHGIRLSPEESLQMIVRRYTTGDDRQWGE